MQDPKDKSQSISVTAFQSVPNDEVGVGLASPMGSRNLSMDADIAQAIQLSLAGQPAGVAPIALVFHSSASLPLLKGDLD